MRFRTSAVATLFVLAACGSGSPVVDTSAEVQTTSQVEEALDDAGPTSTEACELPDPWEMVETAFVGTVTDVETRINEASQFELEGRAGTAPAARWPWVTFEVDRWFTKDFGLFFSMWAPGLEVEPGEKWQVAGSLYWVDQQSGEVFPCLSVAASQAERAAWEDRFGGSVAAGSGASESSADPDLVAEIEANRTVWLERRPDGFTAVVSVFDGRRQTEECGNSTSVRLVVEDGATLEAVDLRRGCRMPDVGEVPTIEETFDLAIRAAGAIDGDISFDERYGVIRSFYASDRSIEVSIGVDVLADTPVPVVLGAENSLRAAESARARWEQTGTASYAMDLEVLCFCTIAGRFEVSVTNGQVDEMRRLDDFGEMDPSTLDTFDFTVQGLFEAMMTWSGDIPESLVAGFHEMGYPVDIRVDAMLDTADDELTLLVRDLTPTE